MKILQVIPSLAPGFGGPTNAVLGFSFALAQKGQEVTIFTTDADVKGRLDVSLDRPVDVNGIKVFYFPIQWLKHYKFSLPLTEALRENVPSFDIIHIHSLFQFSTLVTSHYCQKYRKPYIIRPLGQLDPFVLRRHFIYKRLYLEFFERKNLEKACAVHFTTETEKDWCKHLDLKIHSIVVPLGVDLKEFNNLPQYGVFRARYPELKDKKIILFLSRINFKKGLDILVKAFANLKREREDVHLVIAGPDREGYGKKVKEWLKNEDVLENTTFTGMLLGRDKLAAFRDSDIFVLPSYSENFGMVVIEAMACGIPVIVSNKVNISADITEARAGLVVNIDHIELSHLIQKLLEDPRLRKELVENGKILVQKKFVWGIIAEQLIKVYQSILEKGSK